MGLAQPTTVEAALTLTVAFLGRMDLSGAALDLAATLDQECQTGAQGAKPRHWPILTIATVLKDDRLVVIETSVKVEGVLDSTKDMVENLFLESTKDLEENLSKVQDSVQGCLSLVLGAI